MPTQPSKPQWIEFLPVAPLLEAAVEDVGVVVEDVDVAVAVELALEAEVVLDEDVELSAAAMNTPPAIAGGETVLAFLAACL